MKNLVAKPIVKDQYWVVTDGNQKVGNVMATGSGLSLKLNGKNTFYDSPKDLKRQTRIEFETLKSNRTKISLPMAHFPTPDRIYNSILDIKRKLHLFTKTPKSKCYYTAGWFAINQTGNFEKIFCPKYIFIQRYQYYGPFKTEAEAENVINNL